MKEVQEYEKDLASIRSMMERSVKFFSLSGMSGIMAGIYALAGVTFVYWKAHTPALPFGYLPDGVVDSSRLVQVVLIAMIVLIASIATGFWLSNRKAEKHNVRIWNTTSKTLMINLAIPLVTGGLFILILLGTEHHNLVAPSSLVFYGLALINASANLYDEIRYLGYFEIGLGLISAILPGYGLIFLAVGFGVLHIVYGAVMHYRYDR